MKAVNCTKFLGFGKDMIIYLLSIIAGWFYLLTCQSRITLDGNDGQYDQWLLLVSQEWFLIFLLNEKNSIKSLWVLARDAHIAVTAKHIQNTNF